MTIPNADVSTAAPPTDASAGRRGPKLPPPVVVDDGVKAPTSFTPIQNRDLSPTAPGVRGPKMPAVGVLPTERPSNPPTRPTLPHIDDMLRSLERIHGELPHPDDVAGSPRAKEAAWQRRRTVETLIRQIPVGVQAVAECEADGEIPFLEKARDDQSRWRKEFVAELLELSANPDPDRATVARMNNLKLSIIHIDRDCNRQVVSAVGIAIDEKMREAGYVAPADQPWNIWAAMPGPLPVIEARIAKLKKRREEAQRQLDGDLAAAQHVIDTPDPMADMPVEPVPTTVPGRRGAKNPPPMFGTPEPEGLRTI
jgi:hypothetical protein